MKNKKKLVLDMALYPGISNKWQVGMYITEMHFWAYETPERIVTFKDAENTVSLQRNGGKSSLVSGKLENESVMSYTVASKHIPGVAEKRALKVTLLDSAREVISVDFKYLEDVKDVKGNVLKPSMYVQNCDDKRTSPLNLFGANYAIVDKETGAPCAEPEVGKWYTLYITTSGNKNFKVFPMGRQDTQLTCKVAFKNLMTYDVDMGNTFVASDSGNIAPTSLFKDNNGEWVYSYASYTGWDATYNTAYYRRLYMNHSSAAASEIRFKFKFTQADWPVRDWQGIHSVCNRAG